ncbi:response regulator transcription factor [Altericista sp. CCNU0014]|uniref:response regulator transcription factor n=1 Tax=Altericista sp. CCNU0014 TaxID=3082949 RepID=UPI00385123FE
MAETILVIEDERLTRTNLLNFLGSEGFESLGAENGRIGIQLAQQHLPDLIICDIMMPELDGYDVLTTLQKDPHTAAIPFIFLTMTTHDAALQQGLAMGADDYLNKPITSEELRNAIAAQLGKQQTRTRQSSPDLARNGHSDALNSGALDLDALALQQLMASKDRLLEESFQLLLQRLSSIRHAVEQLQDTTAPENGPHARALQTEFARLLAFVNEASVLQKLLTPSNTTALMEQFTQSARKAGGS